MAQVKRPGGGRTTALAVGVALLLLVMSLTLGADPPRPHFLEQQDKVEHLIAFLALGLAFGWNASFVGLFASAIGLSSAAVGIEVAQGVIDAGRAPAAADAIAGMAGALCGVALAVSISRIGRRAASRPRPA